MTYVPLEALKKKNKSLFRLVLAAAERANEINSGAPPLMETSLKSPTTVALQEFAEGKVYYEHVEKEHSKENPEKK